MWNRKELKEKGKAAVKRNYWKSVLVSAIFAAAVGGAGLCSNSAADTQSNADAALESAEQSSALLLLWFWRWRR